MNIFESNRNMMRIIWKCKPNIELYLLFFVVAAVSSIVIERSHGFHKNVPNDEK